MTQEAHNSVRIHAAHGRSDELGVYLASVMENLKLLPGCMTAAARRDHEDHTLWIVSVTWHSIEAQAAHFAEPTHEGLNGLLSNQYVSRVTFHSMPSDTDAAL